MTFLDSSIIIHYLNEVEHVTEYVDEQTTPPYFTSSLCIYEVLMGPVLSEQRTDLHGEREQFNWVRSLDLNETIAMEANRIQDSLTDAGDQMSPRDVLIAATARSTSDRLIVADDDFEVSALDSLLSISRLDEPTD